MTEEKFFKVNLEVHPTKDVKDNHVNGSLTVVWRDWDNIVKHAPKMVYVSSVNAGEIKGPHLHTKRNSYFVCIRGKVVFVLKENSGEYVEVESSESKPVLVYVPKGIPSAHIGLSDGPSSVLAIADLAWRPNDDEMKNVSFDDYTWNKWQNLQQ